MILFWCPQEFKRVYFLFYMTVFTTFALLMVWTAIVVRVYFHSVHIDSAWASEALLLGTEQLHTSFPFCQLLNFTLSVNMKNMTRDNRTVNKQPVWIFSDSHVECYYCTNKLLCSYMNHNVVVDQNFKCCSQRIWKSEWSGWISVQLVLVHVKVHISSVNGCFDGCAWHDKQRWCWLNYLEVKTNLFLWDRKKTYKIL